MNGILSKVKEVFNLIKSKIKKYKQDQKSRIMKGSQLELYKKYLLQQDKRDIHLQKVLGIILSISLVVGLIFQLTFNEESFNEQLYITIIIASQLLLKIITTSIFFFSKNPSLFIKYFMKFLTQSMTIAPIELLIIQEDTQQIVWVSFIVGAYIMGINISMRDKVFQVISIFFQSSYLIIRISNIQNFIFVIYFERIIEIGIITAVIFYLGQDYGKIFLLNFFFENTKGNTAKSVIKSSLPLPIFATKLKTKNLDSSRLFLQNLDNLELDIVFANKFCRQIFNIKKKIEMKQKLKYLFLQGDSQNNNNNGNNNMNNQSYNRNEYDQNFMTTEFHVGSNELRQKKLSRLEKSVNFNQNSQKVQNNLTTNPNAQLYKNDFWNLQRSQFEAMSPTKEDHNKYDKLVGSQVNGREFQIQPVLADSKQQELYSNQNELKGEFSPNMPNFLTSGALIDGFLYQNQMKKQMMTQQFFKQNFTKQEIKDYGILMTGSQVTNLLYYHILEKLYGSLFNRLRSEANGEIKSQIKEKPNKHQTSLKDLSQQASQAIDNSQEEVFLDVLYIDSSKKSRKFFDIKIIEVEWENENAMMVIMNDISEKMRVKRMKEIDSFKNNILSTITHNLKTPLNGIILTAQSLQSQVNDNVKDALSDVLQNSKLLLYMINDILDYSRLSKGNIHLNLETFSIQKLINEVLSVYKRQTQDKGIKLNYVLMGNLQVSCKLINDFNRIKQILINLIGNAQKCTFEGSITLIFDITAQNLLQISIKDTGIGMDDETIRSIQKIQMKKKKDMRQGVGIGLLIGKSLLQLVGPDKQFKIESEVDQGSTFSFSVYLIHKESKNNNIANGIEISHLQNSFFMDKSQDGASKINFFGGRQKTNKIQTILEEVKFIETQNGFDKFLDDKLMIDVKQTISQKVIPNETVERKDSQYSPPKMTAENINTEENLISPNANFRRKTTDNYLKLFNNQLNNQKQRKSDIGGCISEYNQQFFSNTKNIYQQNHYEFKMIQNQDLEVKNLQSEKYLNYQNQFNMDTLDDESEEENVAQKFLEDNLPSQPFSRVRVLSYNNNSTKNKVLSHQTCKSSISALPKHQEDKILKQLDSSPTSILNEQYLDRRSSENDNINGELDINQETIQQKCKFNFYSQLTDSIYTQDSKQVLNQSEYNSQQNNYRSPKFTKVSSYQQNSQNTDKNQNISSPLNTNQNTLRNIFQQQNQNDSYSAKNSQLTSRENISTEKKLQKLDIINTNNKKYPYRNNSENLSNLNMLSQKSIAEQVIPMSSNVLLSPSKYLKPKSRQYSLNTEINPGSNRAPFLQNSSQFQNLLQLKANSNIYLDDPKNLKISYIQYGTGRLYEFIEESRDIEENANHTENGLEISPNKITPIQSSTTLAINQPERGRTQSIIEKTINKKISYYPQINYEQAIISYFESAPRRVLIVDDTVFNIKALRTILLKYKTAQVEEAFNGQQAVQKVKTTPFDIIFMDINMPVMDGFEATKQIRNLQKEYIIQNNPIIIIVTAFGDQENKMLSFQSGADEHIEKPLTLTSIQKAIYQLIKK